MKMLKITAIDFLSKSMLNKCQRSKGDLVKLLMGSLVWRAPVITLLSNSKWPIELGKGFFSHVKGKENAHVTR